MKQYQKEQALFLYFISLAAAGVCFAMSAPQTALRFEIKIVVILAVAVLISASLLFAFIQSAKPVRTVCMLCACIGVVIFLPTGALPMIAASSVAILTDYLRLSRLIAAVSAIFIIGTGFILYYSWHAARPDGALAPSLAAQDNSPLSALFIIASIFIAALIAGPSLYTVRLLKKREHENRLADAKSDRIEELLGQLHSQSRTARTVEHISKLEERNRLAARIHDEVGHGMSGSILLLEGANAIIKDAPDKAGETVRRVTEHLRESTDKIRAMLREERTDSAEMNLAKIRSELAALESDHRSVQTELTTEGDMEQIGCAVWMCIYENMLEATTNMLKHSDATLFRVSVTNSNKLLHVEFADNGASAEVGTNGTGAGAGASGFATDADARRIGGASADIRHSEDVMRGGGIGLHNMEERCALCHGRCFFRMEADGFHVVMTFPLRQSAAEPLPIQFTSEPLFASFAQEGTHK